MKRVDGLGIERIYDTYTGDVRRERVDLALLAAPVRKAGQDVFGVEFLEHRDYCNRAKQRIEAEQGTISFRSETNARRDYFMLNHTRFFFVRLVVSFAG